MKKQSNNKYQGTKFQVTPKHHNTFAFVPGNDPMPAYNTQGREYKRHLKPMRDKTNIDLGILAKVIATIDPSFNIGAIQLTDGISTVNGTKFRFKDLFDLLQNLRQERLFKGDNFMIKQISKRYDENIERESD